MGRRSRPFDEWYHINEAGCHIWWGATMGNGYAQYWHPIEKRPIQGHIYAWERVHGKRPENINLDHLCRVRLCVNEKHIEVVTCAENTRRGDVAKLNIWKVEKIREKIPFMKVRDISIEFNISKQAIHDIRNGRTWK